MKTILVSILLSLMTIAGISQQTITLPAKKMCNADIFANQSGVLIKNEYIDLIEINRCRICIVRLLNLNNNKSVSALKFEFQLLKASVNLDEDEVDSLMKCIKTLQKSILSTKPKTYTEVIFRSRSGFELGSFFENGKWRTYMKIDYIEKIESSSEVTLEKADLLLLVNTLEQAKEKF